MAGDLAGKAIIITGAGGGIGRAASLVMAAAGAQLIVSDVSRDEGERTATEIRAAGGTAQFVAADLASEDEIREMVEAAVSEYGRLDGAFNNAAIEQHNKPILELSLQEWNKVLAIDLTAVMLCMKYEITAMLKTGGGSIVNTSSGLGQFAMKNASDYVAAKHGVIGLSRAAAVDYGTKGVRVNALIPGIIATPMIKRLSADAATAEVFERLRLRHSLERFGEPHEVGEAAKWLLSDASSFVHGAAIAVDGGLSSI